MQSSSSLFGVALESGLLGLVLLLERLQLGGLGEGVHVEPLGARLPREHLTLGVAHRVAGDAHEVIAGELDLEENGLIVLAQMPRLKIEQWI